MDERDEGEVATVDVGRRANDVQTREEEEREVVTDPVDDAAANVDNARDAGPSVNVRTFRYVTSCIYWLFQC